jgi:hypothetical protein
MEQAQYLTEREVASMTRIAVATLRNNRYLRRGIPFIKIGKSVRYKIQDVVLYLDERRVDVNESE